MDKLFKNKKNRGRNLILLLIPLIVVTVIFVILATNSFKGILGTSAGGESYSNSITEYDYHLRTNATDLQKSLFQELKDELSKDPKDDQKIAVLIAKNFVADFYTWTNKNGTADVGGLYYVYSPNRTAILYQSRKYLYQHLNEYIEKYGSKNLLEVESFVGEPQVSSRQIEVNGKTYNACSFQLDWTYVNKTGGFDTTPYAKTSWFTVYKNDDGRYEIVEIGE